MNVVININSLQENGHTDKEYFIKCVFSPMIFAHPKDHFFIISCSKNESLIAFKNTTLLQSKKQHNNLSEALWYNYRLPFILRKVKADIFINMGAICSLKTNIPQCLVLQNPYVLNNQSPYLKKALVYLNKASTIIAGSQFLANSLCGEYKISEEKVRVIYAAVTAKFSPLLQPEKENYKEKYAEGKEYFLFTGELTVDNNLINLLKAFSFFKKRQKSNMLLIIVATNFVAGSAFEKSLQTYKYRTDVKLIPDPGEDELAVIIAAAYSMVYPTLGDTSYIPILQAMQSGVPVITSDILLMHEICNNAALFINPEVFEHIADKMMQLFKDEQLRNELIDKGIQQAAALKVLPPNDVWWNCIEKSALQKD